MMAYDYPHPVSRTYQYKKITKPLLERKRRARINRCLEELKDLMVDARETEGENISKLEKADILELTVHHLQRLQASRPSGLSSSATSTEEASAESRWRSGFGHCATEACRFLATFPGEAAERLARHLAAGLQLTRQLNVQVASKSDLVSPTLATVDKTANWLVPSGSSTDVTTTVSPNRNPSQKNVRSYFEKSENFANFPTAKSPFVSLENTVTSTTLEVSTIISDSGTDSDYEDGRNLSPLITTRSIGIKKNTTDELQMIVNDEEEEIDVEHVDERDPMWRPW